jgi:hypothetical protein
MAQALARENPPRATENLPKAGKKGKNTLKARREMDRREREVYEMRLAGWTFQAIVDDLVDKAEAIFKETGKMPDHYKHVSNVKDAYDRYVMRCPERFDLPGRNEQLELAIQRAESNYKYALEMSQTALSLDKDGISWADPMARSRWSEQAGKWFDRLTKLRALTEDTTIINNFTQNNITLTNESLVEKLTAKIVESTIIEPDLETFKSHDTVPPMIEAPLSSKDNEEEFDDDFSEPPERIEVNVEVPVNTAEVTHEEIKPKSATSNILFSL